MATTIKNVVKRKNSMVYSGSNSADLNAAIDDFTINSEAGQILAFTSGGESFTANADDRVVFWDGVVQAVLDADDYEDAYIEFLTEEQSLQLPSGAVKAAGIATVPPLVAGVPVTISVDISPAMPNTSFTANVDLFGATNLSSITVNSVTIVDTDTVDVNVQTSDAVFTGLQLLVTAT